MLSFRRLQAFPEDVKQKMTIHFFSFCLVFELKKNCQTLKTILKSKSALQVIKSYLIEKPIISTLNK